MSKNINLLVISICLGLASCVGPPNYTDGLIENVPAIINENDYDLEMVLIVSKGYDEKRETSLMRHKLEKLPKQSYAKIEFLEDSVLALNNEFKVTYFANGNMFDKRFLFRKNTININATRPLPLMEKNGVISS